ncbi:Uncharacterized protein SCF082_LOCUS32043 [Durusdinium trenchii]|uniref:Ubiquitin-like domain-containing protein n=1 Tax=Durusdinium trenchii TaxID=1381693 RepID=A0ABP0NE25_9DINO
MPTILVQPIASSTVEVDLSEDATVADLKSALAQKTGIDIEEQRLVTRGKLLEDSTLIHLVDGRIFLARGSLSKKGDGDEIELTVKMVGATGTWQLRLQADSSTTDFKNQVLLQLNLPTAELGQRLRSFENRTVPMCAPQRPNGYGSKPEPQAQNRIPGSPF